MGKATGSRDPRPATGSACPPLEARPVIDVGHGARAPLPILRTYAFLRTKSCLDTQRVYSQVHITPDANKVHRCGNPATLGQKQHEEYEGGTIETFNRGKLFSRNAHFDSRAGTDEGSGE